MDVGSSQKNAFMSNSGTLTSCFADFIKFPRPACRARKSLSSGMVSICWLLLAGLMGDPMRVGGRDVMSMSIIMLDRLRRAGSRENKGREGIGDTRLSDIDDILDSRIAVEGRGKDHDRTRSRAKTWHPIKNMSITKKFVGCTTNPSCRILAPFAKQI